MGAVSTELNPFDLENFQQRIQQLYIQEKQPLSQVMSILRKEGCLASKNMYLKKIRAWGLDKNERWEKLRTDKIVPIHRSRVSQSNLAISSNTLRLALRLPDLLDKPQQFLAILWTSQSFCVTKHLSQQPSSYSLAARCGQHLMMGTHLISKGQHESGAALVEKAFVHLEMRFQVQMHNLFSELLYSLQFMLSERLYVLAEMFARFLHQLTLKVYGPTHPIATIAKAIYSNWNSVEVLNQGLRLIYDVTASMVGRVNTMSIARLANFVDSLKLLGSKRSDEITGYYEQMIQDSIQVGDPLFRLNLQTDYGSYLVGHGQYTKGISTLEEVIHLLQECHINNGALYTTYLVRAKVLYTSFIIKPQKYDKEFVDDTVSFWQRYHEAKDILQQAQQEAIKYLGPGHEETVHVTQELADLHQTYGFEIESQQQNGFILDQVKEYRLS